VVALKLPKEDSSLLPTMDKVAVAEKLLIESETACSIVRSSGRVNVEALKVMVGLVVGLTVTATILETRVVPLVAVTLTFVEPALTP